MYTPPPWVYTLCGVVKGRPIAQARISPEGSEAIDKAATRENVERSDMIRLMLAYANQHMPPGWRPQNWQPSVYTRKGP